MNIIQIDSCRSTNVALKELLNNDNLLEGSILISHEQTAGKGQAGNHWESEPHKNLTFSMVFYPTFLSISDSFLLSKSVSLGIKDSLDKYTDSLSIKWPNDIYYKDRKIVGILLENEWIGQTFSQSVVGIGINVNQENFFSDAPNPISLKNILGENLDLDLLLENTIDSILRYYELLKNGEIDKINSIYHQSLYRKDGFHPFKDQTGTFEASIEAVGNDGILHLLTNENERKQFAFKEVEWGK